MARDIRTYDAKALKLLCSAVFQDFARYQVPARDSIAVEVPPARRAWRTPCAPSA